MEEKKAVDWKGEALNQLITKKKLQETMTAACHSCPKKGKEARDNNAHLQLIVQSIDKKQRHEAQEARTAT